mmetsp:Transcript_8284/g.21075  ORF Transcript_8284/g.21075 Transcript_8284/m.21075 type:complete len:241 (-) Transcript_8284:1268-1990(-)
MTEALPSSDQEGDGKKTVFLVRHAESMENDKLAAFRGFFRDLRCGTWAGWSRLWHGLSLLSEPSLIDTPLSDLGRRQVAALQKELAQASFLKANSVELLIHSPLQRARDTCAGVVASAESAKDLPLVVDDVIHEKYLREWLPGQITSLDSRIALFGDLIASREENVIMVVGHSQFFRRMLGMPRKFQNCDVWQVDFYPKESRDTLAHVWSEPRKVLSIPKASVLEGENPPRDPRESMQAT